MSLFGIEVYDNYNCAIVEPDSVYRGEIAKAFHLIIEMPECILEASNEKIEEIKYIAVVIMQRIWEEYRFPDKKKNS